MVSWRCSCHMFTLTFAWNVARTYLDRYPSALHPSNGTGHPALCRMKPKTLTLLLLLLLLRQVSALLSPQACTPFKSALKQETLCCDEAANTLFWINKLLGLRICCKLGSILQGLSYTPASTTSSIRPYRLLRRALVMLSPLRVKHAVRS